MDFSYKAAILSLKNHKIFKIKFMVGLKKISINQNLSKEKFIKTKKLIVI